MYCINYSMQCLFTRYILLVVSPSGAMPFVLTKLLSTALATNIVHDTSRSNTNTNKNTCTQDAIHDRLNCLITAHPLQVLAYLFLHTQILVLV